MTIRTIANWHHTISQTWKSSMSESVSIMSTKSQTHNCSSASQQSQVYSCSIKAKTAILQTTVTDSVVQLSQSSTPQPTNQVTTSNVEDHIVVSQSLGYMDQQLQKGNALGSLPFTSTCGTRFRCTNDCVGGRGLRVVDGVAKNVTIARGTGTLVWTDAADAVSSPVFKVWDTNQSLLHLHPPTTAYPANLANTSAGMTRNNCKITHKPGTSYFSIITIRALQPGEEVTVPYGSKFTKELRACQSLREADLRTQRSINCNSKLQCDKCKSWVLKRRMKYHIDRINCLRLQHSNTNK